MKIIPYSMKSESGKALANSVGVKRLYREGTQILVKGTLINWGCSSFKRRIVYENILNKPEAVAKAVNKLQSFKAFQGRVASPEWTESLVEASRWLAEGVTVVGRSTLTGHSGEGITIYNEGDVLKEEKLYVKYINKREEYRLHVFRGHVFFVQRKARKKDVPDDKVNWKVRNHANGFIYSHKEADVPNVAKDIAIAAITSLGLDFGAVDLIYNEAMDKYFALEVNTACGLVGTTLNKYVEVFKEFE